MNPHDFCMESLDAHTFTRFFLLWTVWIACIHANFSDFRQVAVNCCLDTLAELVAMALKRVYWPSVLHCFKGWPWTEAIWESACANSYSAEVWHGSAQHCVRHEISSACLVTRPKNSWIRWTDFPQEQGKLTWSTACLFVTRSQKAGLRVLSNNHLGSRHGR